MIKFDEKSCSQLLMNDIKLRFLEWIIDLHKDSYIYDFASDDSAFEGAINEIWDYLLHCTNTYDIISPEITPRIKRLLLAITKAADLYEEGYEIGKINKKIYSNWENYYLNVIRWINEIDKQISINHFDSSELRKLGYCILVKKIL